MKTSNLFLVSRNIFFLDLAPSEKMVLLYLTSLIGLKVIPKRNTIAKRCGIKSVRTVDKIIKKLIILDYLKVSKRGFMTSNEYFINMNKINSLANSVSEDQSETFDKQNGKIFEEMFSDVFKEVVD